MRRQQQSYNVSHMSTRSIVERSSWILKSRVRCIDTTGGIFPYSPRKCCDIVLAVIVLHSMCIMNCIPLPAGYDNDYPNNVP